MARQKTAKHSEYSALELINAGEKGQGVIAREPFRKGQHVLTFGGSKVKFDDIDDFTHYLELGNGWFLGPSGDLDDYINHSCEPNCEIIFENEYPDLYALRDISVDEEITFDYSTAMWDEPTTFECGCDSSKCRKIIKRKTSQFKSLRTIKH